MAINNKFTRKYSDWVGSWKDKNVHDLNSTYDFVSSESTLLVSGPPEYVLPVSTGVGPAVSDDELIPIGLVQSATIQQRKSIQQLNEIGSRQLFTIPGRTTATASVQRILFDGPSLLFAMSAFYKNGSTDTILIPDVDRTTEGDPSDPYPTSLTASTNYSYMGEYSQGGKDKDLGAFWGNLGSAVFNKPMGLGFIFLDTESQFYGGLYLEKCFIVSYNIGVSSQQTILLEQVQIAVTRVRPIKVGAA
ncbi:MAG TPA: hypothetical protein PKN48_00630 [Bacteroidales bacterium]|nr:hypothetical protein [Bacteroidales bacterium]